MATLDSQGLDSHNAVAGILNAVAQQNKISKGQVDLVNANADLNNLLVGAKSKVNAQLAADEQQGQQRVQQLGKAYGVDPSNMDATQNILTALAQDTLTNAKRVLSNEAELHRIDNSSFFDNPLQAIADHFRRPGIEAGVRVYGQQAERSSALAKEINAGIASGGNTLLALSKTANDKVTADKLDAASIEARLVANEAQQKGLATAAIATTHQLEGNKAIMDTINQQFQQRMSVEHLALARENQAMARQEFSARMEDRKIARMDRQAVIDQKNLDKAMSDNAKTSFVDSIDAVTKAYNLPFAIPGDTTDAKLEYISKLRPGSDMANKVQTVMDVAANLEAQKQAGIIAPSATFGHDPFEAKSNSDILGDKAVMPEEQKVKDMYNSILSQQLTAGVITAKTKPEEARAIFNRDVGLVAKSAMSDVEANPDTNPYAMPKPAVTAAFGQFANTKFYKSIIAPELANGASEMSAKSIATRLIQAADAKVINTDEVVPLLSLYAQEVRNYNNIHANFVGRGAPIQDSVTVMEMNPAAPDPRSAPKIPFDLADQAQAASYIATQHYFMQHKTIADLNKEKPTFIFPGSIK